jgi:hypothetical protein
MYKNLTITTAGELCGKYGVHSGLSENSVCLDTYEHKDDILLALSAFKISFVSSYVSYTDIFFDLFAPEEASMISEIAYDRKGTVGVCNVVTSTCRRKADGSGLSFSDQTEGYTCVMHTMLRKCLVDNPITNVLLGSIHAAFTTFLYAIIVRSFDRKYYNLIEAGETTLSSIYYACACISAAKHFTTHVDINDAAISLTNLRYPRMREDKYVSIEPIRTYSAMAAYFTERNIFPNISADTIIQTFIQKLGPRGIIVLDCGVDLLIDMLLSRSTARAVPTGIYKLIGDTQLANIHRNIVGLYAKQIDPTVNSKVQPLYRARW